MGGELDGPLAIPPGEINSGNYLRLAGPRSRSGRFGEETVFLLPGIEPQIPR